MSKTTKVSAIIVAITILLSNLPGCAVASSGQQSTIANLDTQTATESSDHCTIESGDNYAIEKKGNLYFYTLYDNNKNIVKSVGPLSRIPHIITIEKGVVRIVVQAGTGMGTQSGYYYDPMTNQISIIFSCIHDQKNNKVVYTNQGKVIVQDIFDASLFYTEFDSFENSFSPVAYPFKDIKFLEDENAVSVTYLSGENYNEITEVLSW